MKRTGFKIKPRKPMKKTPLKAIGFLTLKRKAWNVFSKWVRERDKRCVTCGSRDQLQAGHFWHGVLDFDEKNINAQCKQCNYFMSGNLAPYSMYLINKYGPEECRKLEARHWIAMKGEFRSDKDYLDIIEKYTLPKS